MHNEFKQKITNVFSLDTFDIKKLFVLALLLRLPWVWLPLGVFHGWNEAYYLDRATYIANGGSYFDGYNDNPPLFTYVLAFLIWIFGANIPLLRGFIALCGALCALLVSLTTRSALETFSDERTKENHKNIPIYAGLIYATFPLDVIFGKIIQIDTFAIMLSTASLYYAIEGLRIKYATETEIKNVKSKKSIMNLITSGIFLGLGCLSKLPMLFVVIPISYIFFRCAFPDGLKDAKKKTKELIFHMQKLIIFVHVIIPFLIIQMGWYIFILIKSPEFLSKTVESQSNYFGLFEVYNPLYKRVVLIVSLSIFILLSLYYFYNRPTSKFRKGLMFFAFSTSAFAVVFPNHEYYLLPIFVPLSIELSCSLNAKSLKKIIGISVACSICFLVSQPILDVDFESAGKYIINKFGNENNVTYEIKIVCSSPPQLRYYTGMKVMEFNETNLHKDHTIVVITLYDTIWQPSLCKYLSSNFVKDRDDGKVFIYLSTDLIDAC